jgi:hypothetical protein
MRSLLLQISYGMNSKYNMKNRITASNKRKNKDLYTFFLACEFKPHSSLFSVLDPFAYDIKPAFIHGSLGIISYDPPSYSIVDANDDSQPLVGYLITITEPDTLALLDKIKTFNGDNSFNMHYRNIVTAYTDVNEKHDAWCYILSDYVLESFEQIEQIEFGIHDNDKMLISFLEEKLGKSFD